MIIRDQANNQAGFTLIEVVISIAVLAIGVMAVARMQMVAVQGTTMANQMMEDTIGGQDLIERIFAANYSDGALNDTNGNGAGGMDDRDAAADYSLDSTNANYYNPDVDGDGTTDWNIDTINDIVSVSWNVRDNHPNNNAKTINIIMVSNIPGGQKVQEYDFIKGQLTRPLNHQTSK